MTITNSEIVMATPCDVGLRLGQELDRLGIIAANMQGAFAAPSGKGDHLVEAAQSLDLITQSLFELAQFSAEWALLLDGSAALNIGEALTKLRLADVARRLAATGQSLTHEAGTLEMFSEDV